MTEHVPEPPVNQFESMGTLGGEMAGEPAPIPPDGVRSLQSGWNDEMLSIEPEMLEVAGGVPLIYRGKSHMVIGAPGSGKSWTCYWAIAELVRSNEKARCIILDYEADFREVVSRMKSLGMTEDEARRVVYLQPVGDLTGGEAENWQKWAKVSRPWLVVIDSVAQSMGAAGLDENYNPDFVKWNSRMVVPLTMMGITVMMIDHTGHGNTATGQAPSQARGASSKRAAVSGASYMFTTSQPWSKSGNGFAQLKVLKDRHGNRREGEIAAKVAVIVKDNGKDLKMNFTAPGEFSEFRPTMLMQKLSETMEGLTVPTAARTITNATSGKTETLRKALAILVTEGYVSQTAKGYMNIKPYVADDDPKHNPFNSGDTEARPF